MAEPTQIRPPEVPQNVISPEKIIESLQTPQPSTPTPEKPLDVPPLSWEEVIPSSVEIKGVLGKAVLWVGGLVVTLGLWILAVQMISTESRRWPPSDRSPEIQVKPLIGSRRIIPAPVIPDVVIVPETTLPVPGKLTARFYSPSMVDLRWDSVGENYRYRLYSARMASMADPRLETDMLIVAPHFAWTPQEDADAVWLAVSSIDPEGRESPLGRPLRLRLR